MKNIFNDTDTQGVSVLRLYVMRLLYGLNFVFLGKGMWTEIFTHEGAWQPLPAVALSFWAALSLLMGLGILHPLKMIPILLIQLV
jgi:hypothetical protein